MQPRIDPDRYAEVARAITDEVGKVIVGQHDLVRDALVCLLAEGHLLIEGVPGLGKTRLVSTLAGVVGLESDRIQFTPDLMPADIVGTQVLVTDDIGGRSFRFEAGPVFTSLLLAVQIVFVADLVKVVDDPIPQVLAVARLEEQLVQPVRL